MHETAPFVSEHVRRDLVERYGNDRLLTDGLTVSTTVDLDLEREATTASIQRLIAVDKRQGYRGPLTKIDPKTTLKLGSRATSWRLKRRSPTSASWSARRARPQIRSPALGSTPTTSASSSRSQGWRARSASAIASKGWLPLEKMKWARKPNPDVNASYFPAVDNAAKVLAVGDVDPREDAPRRGDASDHQAQGCTRGRRSSRWSRSRRCRTRSSRWTRRAATSSR